jgi:hypothetical protein
VSDKLVVPDKRIVSIDEAREERENRKKPRGVDSKYDLLSRVEAAETYVPKEDMVRLVKKMNTGIADAALDVGQKIYDQIADETDARLQAHAHVLMQMVHKEIESRTFRGRVRAFFARWRDYLIELGILSPIPSAENVRLVDASEALDPNVQERLTEERIQAIENESAEQHATALSQLADRAIARAEQ